MRKFLILLISITLFQFSQSQTLTIANGTHFVVGNNSKLVLTDVGITNDGTLSGVNSAVIMEGSALSTINGTGSYNFYDLFLNTSNGVSLGNNIKVGNMLTTKSMFYVKSFTVDLGTGGSISNETNDTRIVADDGTTGQVTLTHNYIAPLINRNPGNIGVEFVNAPVLGTTTISRIATAPVNNGSSVGLVKRYYNIQPQNNVGLGATVRFYYFDAELNGVNENTAVLWKSTNNGASWSQLQPDARDNVLNYVEKNNVNDFSLWAIGNNNSVLPLLLNYFNTSCNAEGANLIWSTAWEQNTDFFLIEKSTDAINWSAIKTITAKGTAAEYNFSDKVAGIAFYRLKQVDKDGKFTYSKTLQSNCDVKSFTILLYPNPATDYTDLQFKSEESFATTIQLVAANGQIVRSIPTQVNKGVNTIRVNLSGINKGTYILSIQHKNLSINKRWIKL